MAVLRSSAQRSLNASASVGRTVRIRPTRGTALVVPMPPSMRLNTSPEAIGADHHGDIFDAIRERLQAEAVAIDAIGLVDADAGDEQADAERDQRVEQRAATERDHAGDAEQDQREDTRPSTA